MKREFGVFAELLGKAGLSATLVLADWGGIVVAVCAAPKLVWCCLSFFQIPA
jgi:hypothetical protein